MKTTGWETLPLPPIEVADSNVVPFRRRLLVVGRGGELGAQAAIYSLSRGWSPLPSLPIRFAHGPALACSLSEVFMWGGIAGDRPRDAVSGELRDDGALYSRSTGWRVLPSAPLSARAYPYAIATASLFVVWGGWRFDESGSSLFCRDGAVFDVSSNHWKAIAPVEHSAAALETVQWNGRLICIPTDSVPTIEVSWSADLKVDQIDERAASTRTHAPIIYDYSTEDWHPIPACTDLADAWLVDVGDHLVGVRPTLTTFSWWPLSGEVREHGVVPEQPGRNDVLGFAAASDGGTFLVLMTESGEVNVWRSCLDMQWTALDSPPTWLAGRTYVRWICIDSTIIGWGGWDDPRLSDGEEAGDAAAMTAECV